MSMRATGLVWMGLLAGSAFAAAPQFPFEASFEQESRANWELIKGTWSFADGAATQRSAEYDCALGVPVAPSGPFYLSIRFKPTSSFNGGGLMFGLPAADSKAGGIMVRCDPGGRVLWGRFDRSGNFEYMADTQVEDTLEEQTLAIAADPQKLAFNIFHNGKLVAPDISATHVQGYVAMQTSGGPHRITGFELRKAKSGELEGLSTPDQFSRVVDIQGDDQRLVLLRRAADFLLAMNGAGEVTGKVEQDDLPGWSGGSLGAMALALRSKASSEEPYVYALLGEGRLVYAFDRKLQPVGDGPLVSLGDMQGQGIAVDAAGRIYVTDSGLPGVRVFDADGERLLTYGEKGGVDVRAEPKPASAGKFNQPRGIAIRDDGLIVIADRGNLTYVAYRYSPSDNQLVWETNGPWLPFPEAVQFNADGNLLLSSTYEYYRSYGALRVLRLDGHALNLFLGHALGDLSDSLRTTQGPGGKYYLADAENHRILVLPEHFVETLPAFDWVTDGVKLTMTKVDGSLVTSVNTELSSAYPERIRVEQPEPICTVWPADRANLREYYIPKPPPAGKKYVIDMPVLVAILTEAKDEKGKVFKLAADPQAVVARLKDEMRPDRTFYWHNSYATLNKTFDFMVIEDEVGPLSGGWVTPTPGRALVNRAREQRGLEPLSRDDSLVVIHPLDREFDVMVRDDLGMVSGGGFTTYGYSGYALWNNGQSWLMAHEWGHQLDSYFDASGMTDWWLNHPDGTVHVGRYGEHWDCNAYLCRRVDPMNWLRFRYGTMRLVDDADGDGLPDDDPSLPMDEARFGSDPNLADTDNDGLTDLEELMAGSFVPSSPRSKDTDDDGIPDDEDVYPQFAVSQTLPEIEPLADGTAPMNAVASLGTITAAWNGADVSAAYDRDHVYLQVRLQKPTNQIHATLDFANDGWFIGRDNVYAVATLREDPAGELSVSGSNCAVQLEREQERLVVHMTIERPPARRPLKPGSSIGMTIRLQEPGGRVAFLIEPWQILGLELD